MEYNDEPAEEPWWESEIENLKSSLKALNVQMFEQKKQWLAEKTALEAAAAGGHSANSNGSTISQANSRSFGTIGSHSSNSRLDSGLSRSMGVNRNGTLQDSGMSMGRTNGLERSPGLDREGAFQDDPTILRVQLQQANSHLATVTAEREKAREEAAVLRSQAQRWNVERAALQREVEVLRTSAGTGGRHQLDTGGDLASALAASEEEKAALASELELIKQSLKNNVLVPKAHMAQLTSGGGAGSAGGAGSTGGAGTGHASRPSTQNLSESRAASASANGIDPSITISRLNAEITRLQADLYIIKDECVPVPKSEFASLKGVHTEKASTEQELRAVRQELADVTRLNKMLREEMELIKEEHIAITVQEYDELRRASAEKQALELKLEAQAKYYAQVPKEELAELQAARRSLAGLETRLAAAQAVATVAKGDTSRALTLASDEAADLRVKLSESESVCAELRKEVSLAEGRAAVIMELQDKIRAAEGAIVATQQEKARTALRIRALEEDLEVSKNSMKDAQAESARLAVELGTLKDTCSGLAQEVATLSRERGELDSRNSELRSEREKLTNELVDAKLELARLREMEVHFRKTVVTNQKALYGLPSQYKPASAERAE